MASSSASGSSSSFEFEESDMDMYLQQFQPYTFIQEQGFDLLMRNCKGIWKNPTNREWTQFCLPSKEPLVIPIVQEFYLALKKREESIPFF